jgi:hypothetical protein
LHVADWLVAEMGFGFLPFDHPAWLDSVRATPSVLSEHNVGRTPGKDAGASIGASWSLPDGTR